MLLSLFCYWCLRNEIKPISENSNLQRLELLGNNPRTLMVIRTQVYKKCLEVDKLLPPPKRYKEASAKPQGERYIQRP